MLQVHFGLKLVPSTDRRVLVLPLEEEHFGRRGFLSRIRLPGSLQFSFSSMEEQRWLLVDGLLFS